MQTPSIVSTAGIEFVKQWEGLRLRPFFDHTRPSPAWIVGYAHTDPGIGPRTRWTLAQAENALRKDMENHGKTVAKLIGSAPTTQSQFDALAVYQHATGQLRGSDFLNAHLAADSARVRRRLTGYGGAGSGHNQGLGKWGTALAALYAADRPKRLRGAIKPQ